RNGKPAYGIRMANENVDRPLPTKDIVITNNTLGGVGDIGYGAYEANTGMSNVTINSNTIYSTPDPIINGSSGGGDPAPTPSPTPTPTPVDHGVTAVNDQYSVTKDKALTVDA